MDLRNKYIDRLKEICGLFEIGWDMNPDIFEPSDIDAYVSAVEELRFLTGRNQVNTYLIEIEMKKKELPWDYYKS